MNRLSDPRAAADHVRRNIDIIKVITDELGPAPKTSGQDHVWCCPFHNESTPSFYVHTQTQIFKCFGCGKGGNVVQWAQYYQGLTFVEAIIWLAKRHVIDISGYERPPTPEELQIERYQWICSTAADICNKQLLNNKAILDWYLKDTGFTLDQVVDYEVGFSSSVDNLVNEIHKVIPSVTQDEIDKLEFTNRLMWSNALVYPVKNAAGATVKFHNKPLSPPQDWGGKYAGNTSHHPLFSHGMLFGLHLLRKKIRDDKYIVRLVEGQKAAMACGGLAVLGSSIHEDQIKVLQEHQVKEIRVCFDGDEAGRKASLRLLDHIDIMTNTHVLVARMPDDKQPDDIYREQGKEGLDKIFSAAVLPVQFFIDTKRNAQGAIEAADRMAVIHELKSFLTALPPIHLDLTAKYLADALSVEIESVKSYVEDLKLTRSHLVNRDIELAVIRHLLLVPRAFSIARQAITDPKTFTVGAYQFVWGALEAAHKRARNASGAESVTVQAVRDELAVLFPKFKELSKVIDTILATEPKYEFVDGLQRLVDLYRRRLGIEQSKVFGSLMQDLGQTTNELVAKFRRQLVSSLDVRRNDISSPIDLADQVMKEIEARMQRNTSIVGYDFSRLIDVEGETINCLTGLTVALSGLQRKHQVIISANTGVGKSLLALQMAVALSICPAPEDQVPCLWIPLEMNEVEITFRIISMMTGVNNDKVQSGQMDPGEFLKVQEALRRIATSQFHIRKPRIGSADEIFSIIEEYHFRHGIKAVFTDYIQLIAPGQHEYGMPRHELWGKASKMLKNQVAEQMDIVSICIAQLNRSNFKEGEAGRAENMGGSYEVSQDADDLMTIAQKTDLQMAEEKNMRGNRFIFLDKRRGGTSDTVIHVDVDTSTAKNLRFIEKMPIEAMMGLAQTIKK